MSNHQGPRVLENAIHAFKLAPFYHDKNVKKYISPKNYWWTNLDYGEGRASRFKAYRPNVSPGYCLQISTKISTKEKWQNLTSSYLGHDKMSLLHAVPQQQGLTMQNRKWASVIGSLFSRNGLEKKKGAKKRASNRVIPLALRTSYSRDNTCASSKSHGTYRGWSMVRKYAVVYSQHHQRRMGVQR